MHGQTAYCPGLWLSAAWWEGLLALALVFSVPKDMWSLEGWELSVFQLSLWARPKFNLFSFSQSEQTVTAWEGILYAFNLNGLLRVSKWLQWTRVAYLKIFSGCEHCSVGWAYLESLVCVNTFSSLLVSQWGRESLEGYQEWTGFQSLLLASSLSVWGQ